MDVEFSRRFEIDNELPMSRVDVRQLLGLCAVENHRGPNTEPAINLGKVGAVAHEAASIDIFAPGVARRYLVLVGKPDDFIPMAVEERIPADEERISLLAGGGLKSGLKFGKTAGCQRLRPFSFLNKHRRAFVDELIDIGVVAEQFAQPLVAVMIFDVWRAHC